MDRIIVDIKISPNLALCWAVNAKNSLQNAAGFNPFQIKFGTNPRLPSTNYDNLPAFTMKPSSKTIEDNLNSLQSARKAFISSENDERIRRALSHNVRSSSEIKYISGDTVLYKRPESNEERGPATVIGHINQQVFVKH